jgi:hypothetical protein
MPSPTVEEIRALTAIVAELRRSLDEQAADLKRTREEAEILCEQIHERRRQKALLLRQPGP